MLRLIAFVLALGLSGAEAANTAALCVGAGDAAAARHGVPRDVMRAVSLVETGRRREGRLLPWPWTVNMEGEGRWFSSRAEALDFVQKRQGQGARSFDIGCFQVNHLWHGDGFASVEAMFDPTLNADYAARFLLSLHEETGDWMRAAGHYHSRTPALADRYRLKIETTMARLGTGPDLPDMAQPDRARPEPPFLRAAAPLIRQRASLGGGGAATTGGVSLAVFGRRKAQPLIGWATSPSARTGG